MNDGSATIGMIAGERPTSELFSSRPTKLSTPGNALPLCQLPENPVENADQAETANEEVPSSYYVRLKLGFLRKFYRFMPASGSSCPSCVLSASWTDEADHFIRHGLIGVRQVGKPDVNNLGSVRLISAEREGYGYDAIPYDAMPQPLAQWVR